MNSLFPKSLSLIILGGILSQAFCIVCQPIHAVVSNETTLSVSGNNSNLTQFSTYEDEDFGFTIQYPSTWNLTQDTTLNKVADFSSPEDDIDISVRVFPRIDNETLKDRGDDLKNNSDFKIREYYRNSTTKLAGLPAISVSGSYFNTISAFEQALGYQSSITKTHQIWALDEERDEFYVVVMHADRSGYDKYLPIVKKMIDSFQLIEIAPIIQEED